MEKILFGEIFIFVHNGVHKGGYNGKKTTPCKLSFFQKLRHNEIKIFSTGITAIFTSWNDSITDCVRSDSFSFDISLIVKNEKE
jgi:hypothetical protein